MDSKGEITKQNDELKEQMEKLMAENDPKKPCCHEAIGAGTEEVT